MNMWWRRILLYLSFELFAGTHKCTIYPAKSQIIVRVYSRLTAHPAGKVIPQEPFLKNP
jgi:hypothetical protein